MMGQGLLLQPLSLELDRGKIAQRGMDTFVRVYLIEESAQLLEGISIVSIVR
jgi:hypothetical protein